MKDRKGINSRRYIRAGAVETTLDEINIRSLRNSRQEFPPIELPVQLQTLQSFGARPTVICSPHHGSLFHSPFLPFVNGLLSICMAGTQTPIELLGLNKDFY
ncbi:hypothetical protein AVEN_264984-1 [Araneus ventricosus]|uniref:Uncharacterized protein n=1 Tax=Araneus ventricosus TaxID=182803 RepID=A0A4Y2ERJ3_ARAVE|nr:hypothetical protein AVEN_264984-1 [Araneus ventricosus]